MGRNLAAGEITCLVLIQGFPGRSAVKNPPTNARDARDPWVRKIPWRRKWQPPPVFLPGESHGQRSLEGTVHGVTKSRTRLSEHMHVCS